MNNLRKITIEEADKIIYKFGVGKVWCLFSEKENPSGNGDVHKGPLCTICEDTGEFAFRSFDGDDNHFYKHCWIDSEWVSLESKQLNDKASDLKNILTKDIVTPEDRIRILENKVKELKYKLEQARGESLYNMSHSNNNYSTVNSSTNNKMPSGLVQIMSESPQRGDAIGPYAADEWPGMSDHNSYPKREYPKIPQDTENYGYCKDTGKMIRYSLIQYY